MHRHADSKLVIAATVIVLAASVYFLILSPLVFNKSSDEESSAVQQNAPTLTPQDSDRYVPNLPNPAPPPVPPAS